MLSCWFLWTYSEYLLGRPVVFGPPKYLGRRREEHFSNHTSPRNTNTIRGLPSACSLPFLETRHLSLLISNLGKIVSCITDDIIVYICYSQLACNTLLGMRFSEFGAILPTHSATFEHTRPHPSFPVSGLLLLCCVLVHIFNCDER